MHTPDKIETPLTDGIEKPPEGDQPHELDETRTPLPDNVDKPPEADCPHPLNLENQPPLGPQPVENNQQTQTKWLTGARLRWVATAFALADLMLAIDGTILGKSEGHPHTEINTTNAAQQQQSPTSRAISTRWITSGGGAVRTS